MLSQRVSCSPSRTCSWPHSDMCIQSSYFCCGSRGDLAECYEVPLTRCSLRLPLFHNRSYRRKRVGCLCNGRIWNGVSLGNTVGSVVGDSVASLYCHCKCRSAAYHVTLTHFYVSQSSVLAAVGLVSPVEQMVTLSFLFVLVYNVIGGWNIDMYASNFGWVRTYAFTSPQLCNRADAGYVFFEYAPFYHANHLLRKCVVGVGWTCFESPVVNTRMMPV